MKTFNIMFMTSLVITQCHFLKAKNEKASTSIERKSAIELSEDSSQIFEEIIHSLGVTFDVRGLSDTGISHTKIAVSGEKPYLRGFLKRLNFLKSSGMLVDVHARLRRHFQSVQVFARVNHESTFLRGHTIRYQSEDKSLRIYIDKENTFFDYERALLTVLRMPQIVERIFPNGIKKSFEIFFQTSVSDIQFISNADEAYLTKAKMFAESDVVLALMREAFAGEVSRAANMKEWDEHAVTLRLGGANMHAKLFFSKSEFVKIVDEATRGAARKYQEHYVNTMQKFFKIYEDKFAKEKLTDSELAEFKSLQEKVMAKLGGFSYPVTASFRQLMQKSNARLQSNFVRLSDDLPLNPILIDMMKVAEEGGFEDLIANVLLSAMDVSKVVSDIP